MTKPHDPTENYLLAALLNAAYDRIAPHLELISIKYGEILHGPGAASEYVYFPTNAIISLQNYVEEFGLTEIAGVGCEGVSGIFTSIGKHVAPTRTVVQTAGYGFRLKASILMCEFNRAGPVMQLILRYNQMLLAHASQIAICHQHHFIEQQLCRWLLLNLERLPINGPTFTHDLIARALGVRRDVIGDAAVQLQISESIHCWCDRLTVSDRLGLEDCVCECYDVVRNEFAHYLDDINPCHALAYAAPLLRHSRNLVSSDIDIGL